MPRDDDDTDPRWASLEERDSERAEEYGDDHADVLYERALLAWEQAGPEAAIPLLDELLRVEAEHADAHYLRGFACAAAGELEQMISHFLATLQLDAQLADELGLEDEDQLDFIEACAEQVLTRVPAEFREHLRNVPIVLEARPHVELVREGFDPRSLGLFEGLEQGRVDAGEPVLAPTRIVLYYANLLADFPDREQLAEEIEITMLHEIGHYFGLDEDDMERLGLE